MAQMLRALAVLAKVWSLVASSYIRQLTTVVTLALGDSIAAHTWYTCTYTHRNKQSFGDNSVKLKIESVEEGPRGYPLVSACVLTCRGRP